MNINCSGPSSFQPSVPSYACAASLQMRVPVPTATATVPPVPTGLAVGSANRGGFGALDTPRLVAAKTSLFSFLAGSGLSPVSTTGSSGTRGPLIHVLISLSGSSFLIRVPLSLRRDFFLFVFCTLYLQRPQDFCV